MERKSNYLDYDKIPAGFGMALAENMEALQLFAGMNSAMQQEIINRTHNMSSSADMKQFVDNLDNDTLGS